MKNTNIITTTNNTNTTNSKGVNNMKMTNKIKTRIIAGLLSAITVFTTGAIALTSASAAEKKVSSENWMKNISDDVKITSLNIPGAHDAAMVHSSAVYPVSVYTLTQKYHIGTQTWTDSGFCRDDKKVSEKGLLERGVRYLDIRYGLLGSKDDRSHTTQKHASDRLRLVHGTFTAQCKVRDDSFGIAHYDDVNNEKLMSWLKTFLDNNPSETVILDIGTDDYKSVNPAVESFVYDFYKNQAENPSKNYPEIYVGDHVPTLGEARGKLVILTSIDPNNYWKDVDKSIVEKNDFCVYRNGEYAGDWAFKNEYTVGNKEKMTFGLAKRDDCKKYSIYKDNYWEEDSIRYIKKWVWVQNGLNDAERIHYLENGKGYDAFMLNYTSANTFSALCGPKTYAEIVIPKMAEYIKNNPDVTKYYGIIAMDFCDTDNKGDLEKQDFGSDTLIRMIFETNFNMLHC